MPLNCDPYQEPSLIPCASGRSSNDVLTYSYLTTALVDWNVPSWLAGILCLKQCSWLAKKTLQLQLLIRAEPVEDNPLVKTNPGCLEDEILEQREWNSYLNILGGGLEKNHQFLHYQKAPYGYFRLLWLTSLSSSLGVVPSFHDWNQVWNDPSAVPLSNAMVVLFECSEILLSTKFHNCEKKCVSILNVYLVFQPLYFLVSEWRWIHVCRLKLSTKVYGWLAHSGSDPVWPSIFTLVAIWAC